MWTVPLNDQIRRELFQTFIWIFINFLIQKTHTFYFACKFVKNAQILAKSKRS
jgi:hypothetical protein